MLEADVGVFKKISDTEIVLWVPKGTHHEFGYCNPDGDLIVIPVGWDGGIYFSEPCRVVLYLESKEWGIFCDNGRFDCSISVPSNEQLRIYAAHSTLTPERHYLEQIKKCDPIKVTGRSVRDFLEPRE